MDQPTFADLEYGGKKRKTRRELYLERVDGLIPWQRLEERIRPYYAALPKGKSVGHHVWPKMCGKPRTISTSHGRTGTGIPGATGLPGNPRPGQTSVERPMGGDRADGRGGGKEPASGIHDVQPTGRGVEYSQDEIEQTLARWINYRPGQDIDMARLKRIFGKS